MNTSDTLSPTDLWLAGCTGQSVSPAQQNSKHYAEGSLVRSLFHLRLHAQSERKDMPAPTDASEQRHWQNILEQVRREGRFVPARPRKPVQAPDGGRWSAIASNHHWFALVASVAVLAVGLSSFMQQHEITQDDNTVIMRGDEAAQRIAAKPNQTAGQLAGQIEAILQQHQLAYRRTELAGGGVQIQAKVPMNSPARQALQALGMKPLAHERLNVLVLAP